MDTLSETAPVTIRTFAGNTPEYVSRLIKEATNMTYSEILLRIRMERAEEMLTNTNMTVAAIAGEIGYETTEHFIRQFKKYAKETPTAYRRSHAAALKVG